MATVRTDAADRPVHDLEAVVATCVRSVHLMASGELRDFEQVFHPDASNREAKDEPPDCRQPGPAGFFATARWLRAPIEGLAFEVLETVAQDDLVVVNTVMRGRQVDTMVMHGPGGEVVGAFPARGRTFATSQTHWFRMRDGLIVEHWANRDDLGTAEQLGWVPPTPPYLVRMARAKRRAARAARQDT
ncbi:hypothetical protein BH10ACT3_BH10ACT3_09430 [soil metagenome]